jgi:beta-glucanase (GH16 family)
MQVGASFEGVEKPAGSASPEASPREPAANSFPEERAELDRVLSNPEINRSTSLVRFLSFICNKYFDGESQDIREYSIAVEALGRKEADFDSHIDPIVRVTARALRKKLREYYKDEGRDHPVQIFLPLGHYVPEFVRNSGESRATEESHSESAAVAEVEAGEVAEAREPAKTGAGAFGFLRAHRRAAWNIGALLLIAPAIFVAGYFWGKRGSQPAQVAETSFQWGEPVWSDEFNGAVQDIPDPAKWTYDTGNAADWGNREIETYCSPRGENPGLCDPKHPTVFQDGAGHLVLRAWRNANGEWTSGRITTRGLKNFQYGRIEARIKMPVGTGLWPSFWMLGSDYGKVGWPASGSVTIVENVSLTERTNGVGPTMIRSTVHGPRYFGGNGLWRDYKLPNGGRVDDGNFHTYGIVWSPSMIQFYVDDPANVFSVQDASSLPEGGQWVFDHPFYLLLNLAIGGDWPGSPDATTPNPAEMLVDYVRVYKIPTVPAPSIQWHPVQVSAGSSVASIISLRVQSFSGRVHLSCATEPAVAHCALATSVVDFSDTLSQDDTLTISTETFTDKGPILAQPGRYKMTITATTISGDHSQLAVPFDVVGTQ